MENTKYSVLYNEGGEILETLYETDSFYDAIEYIKEQYRIDKISDIKGDYEYVLQNNENGARWS